MREVKTDTVNFSLNLANCSPAVTNVVMQTLQNGDCECCDEYDPWDEEDED